MTRTIQRLPLTQRSEQCLKYIQAYQQTFGLMPTIGEIADQFEVTRRAAWVWVNLLVERGLLVRTPNTIRGLTIASEVKPHE